VGGALDRIGLKLGTDLEQMARGHNTLSDAASRSAFLHTLRAVVDPAGQRVDATNRLYLAELMPLLLIWGERDSIIPVSHGRAAHARVPSSRLEVLERSGHFPQLDEPECFLDVLLDFIEQTEPASVSALGAGGGEDALQTAG
jgi:pimeloyl-ACP methyl ester carboxylesterase